MSASRRLRRATRAWRPSVDEEVHITVPGPGGGTGRDSNGRPVERKIFGEQVVIVHDDDVPPGDLTIVQGIPVTTPLRTVIDLASSIDARDLGHMVQDALRRGLFTSDEARARIAAPDLAGHPGAALLGRALPPE